jgi:hypothetical protein
MSPDLAGSFSVEHGPVCPRGAGLFGHGGILGPMPINSPPAFFNYLKASGRITAPRFPEPSTPSARHGGI